MSENENRIKLVVAIVGLIGVLAAALIGNWDSIFDQKRDSIEKSENIINGDNSNIINNNSGEINVN